MHALRPLCLLAAGLLFGGPAVAQLDVLPEPPANAQPGECYGLVYVPPLYRRIEESQLVTPASERLEVVPAQYEYVNEPVTLPAGKRRKIVKPAVTETYEQTVTVPGASRRVAVPATYKTVTEQVTVAQGAVMKPGKTFEGQEGGALCLVEQPTAQQTVKKRVLDRPASTRLVEQPAREKVVRRKKVLEPAVTELVDMPERTITRRVKRLVAPETTRSVRVPAQYETVVRKEITAPARAEWQRVLCETNVTPSLVQSLQEALRREGAYRGVANGQLNPQTASAVRLYQERHELPTGGLSLATLDHLGVHVSEGQVAAPR